MTEQVQNRGRPRTAAQPLTSAERARRRRARLRAQGTTSHTISLSPEITQGLEEWVRLIDTQRSLDEKIEATAVFGLNKLLEPGKQEMLAAFADSDNRPIGRLLALLGAMGVEKLQSELSNELQAKARSKRYS